MNKNKIIKTNKKICLFLNKEYKNLEEKFSFINNNKIEIVLTVHQNYKQWNKKCPNSKFYKIPFAYDPNIFKRYDQEKTLDIGFSGNLFNTGIFTTISPNGVPYMGNNFNNVRERIFDKLKEPQFNKYNKFLGGGVFLKGEEYGRKINSSKIWICTPSAIDIIGPRFYEILGSNTLLFCKNIEGVYTGLFEENIHYVGFRDDLSDFEEKVVYYLENDIEREKISSNGHKMAMQKHTWNKRVDKIYDVLSKYASQGVFK